MAIDTGICTSIYYIINSNDLCYTYLLQIYDNTINGYQTAFLNAVIVKSIYMAAPDGNTVGSDVFLLLKKSLYGLTQFHRKLTVDLNQCVKLMKFKHTISDV